MTRWFLLPQHSSSVWYWYTDDEGGLVARWSDGSLVPLPTFKPSQIEAAVLVGDMLEVMTDPDRA